MLFLGLRNAAVRGLAIPMSMFISFTLLNAFGVTLNMMVLFALILALGRLVDDGIVIVENIHRHMTNGEPAMKATRLAVGEVTMPIIAATTATVMVFVPLLFWPGMMGEFMKYLPITFMIALGSSLFVALVVNPALASKFMKVEEDAYAHEEDVAPVRSSSLWGCHHRRHGRWQRRARACSASACSPSSSASWAVANEKLFAPAANWFQFKWLPRWKRGTRVSCATRLDKHHPRTFLLRHVRPADPLFCAAGRVPAEDPVLPRRTNRSSSMPSSRRPSARTSSRPTASPASWSAQVMKVIDVPDYMEVR
jgi:hypothetical protein